MLDFDKNWLYTCLITCPFTAFCKLFKGGKTWKTTSLFCKTATLFGNFGKIKKYILLMHIKQYK